EQGTEEAGRLEAPAPRQDDTAGEDHEHAEGDALVELLAEDEPGEPRGEHRLGVEQQRRGRGRGERDPRDQAQWRERAAGEDRGGEPGNVASRQRVRRLSRGSATAEPEEREAGA